MSDILVTTPNGPHSIEEMYNLRQFAAHGQATYKSVHRNVTGQAINRPENCPIKDLDYLILGELPTLMGAALERYLTELKLNDALAVKLADAGVTAFSARPLFDSMGNFPADTDVYPVAIGDAIRGMDWTYNPTFTSI